MTSEGTPIPVVDPAAPPAPAPAVATEIEDIDARELREAEEAAKAEEAAPAADGDKPAEGAAPAQGQPPAAAPAKPADVVMIPKPRLDEALKQTDEAKRAAAYWQGVAEGRQQPSAASANGGQPPAPQPPTIDQQLAEIATKTDALAKKFDDGEITMSDFKKQERELTNQEAALREQATLAKVAPAKAPQDAGADALYLDTLTAQIEKDHPWVSVFDQTATQAEWDAVKHMAKQNCVDRGIDPTKGAVGSYELRKEMAKIVTQLAPAMVTDRATAKGIALPGQQQQAPAAGAPAPKAPLSAAASAREKKLTLAETAPPNLAAMSGAVGDSPGLVSEASIERMSEDDIGALPKAVQDKILNQLA